MIGLGRLATVSASLAAFGMVATPVAAAQLPSPAHHVPGVYDAEAGNAHGWRYPRYRRHSGAHIRTGDAIAGIAILGAVAAIASAANNDRNRTREVYRERPRERDTWRYSDNRRNDWNRGGITGAVDLCVNQVERGDDRVDTVDNATRDGSGWQVQGTLSDGAGFSCRLDNEGRIRAIDIGNGGYSQASPASGSQWDDQAYLSARASTRTAIDEQPDAAYGYSAAPADQPQPAYPGGPLPGEEIDADLGG